MTAEILKCLWQLLKMLLDESSDDINVDLGTVKLEKLVCHYEGCKSVFKSVSGKVDADNLGIPLRS